MSVDVPSDVIDWVRSVFSAANVRITEKLDTNPKAPEESLDLTWIEQLSRYSSATTFGSNWTAWIQTHYLGGMRHFYRWEIADIGVLVFLRLPEEKVSKVALLQSKRLYPRASSVQEETMSDFEVGFARLADPEDEALPLSMAADFRFDGDCVFGALKSGSEQVKLISKYQEQNRLKVYYQLYGPSSVPFEQRIPLEEPVPPTERPTLGTRIVPADVTHARLEEIDHTSPRLDDMKSFDGLPAYGWRLEDFMCDQVLACREGDRFGSVNEERIQDLFFRRGGPITAAISLTIEAPNALD